MIEMYKIDKVNDNKWFLAHGELAHNRFVSAMNLLLFGKMDVKWVRIGRPHRSHDAAQSALEEMSR